MPRQPRIHFPGAVYHVILRGNAGDPIFFEDRDRYRLYLFLQQATETFRCRIHGFCLMTNHIHLILQVSDLPLSLFMQNISQRFTKWINFSQGRTGHLFQGRYKALLLDADAYLLELVRYVHLNPVRAGMVTFPDQHPWSGHRAYLGMEAIPWLTTDWILSLLSDEKGKARQAYKEFVLHELEGGRKEEYHGGSVAKGILGEDRFADEALRQVKHQRPPEYSVADVLGRVCQSYQTTIAQLQAPGKQRPFSEARALAAFVIQESPHLSLTELGRQLNRSITPLSRAARLLATKAVTDISLQKRMMDVQQSL